MPTSDKAHKINDFVGFVFLFSVTPKTNKRNSRNKRHEHTSQRYIIATRESALTGNVTVSDAFPSFHYMNQMTSLTSCNLYLHSAFATTFEPEDNFRTILYAKCQDDNMKRNKKSTL